MQNSSLLLLGFQPVHDSITTIPGTEHQEHNRLEQKEEDRQYNECDNQPKWPKDNDGKDPDCLIVFEENFRQTDPNPKTNRTDDDSNEV